MTATWLTKQELASRWRGATILVVAIFAMLILGLMVYQSMGLETYQSLPEVVRHLMGLPHGASPEILAYNEMLGVMGALSLGGVAVAIGADTIAGDEGRRTLALLTSHPVSRTTIALVKAASLIAIVAATSAALWLAAVIAASLVGADTGEAHLAALCLVIGANALLHGSLAFAIGAATGNKTAAAGIASLVLALGWVLSGLLPMWPDAADAVDYVPYAWYTQAQALVDGTSGPRLIAQLGVAALLLAVGIFAFRLRDLRSLPATGAAAKLRSLAARLPQLPSGSTGSTGSTRTGRTASLAGVRFARNATLVAVMALVFVAWPMAMGPVYKQMAPTLADTMAAIPPAMMQVFGAGDMTTPAGFFWGEVMGLVAPIALIVLVAFVAQGLAAEERSGLVGLLLGHPVPRHRLLSTTIAVAVAYTLIFAAAVGLGIWSGSQVAGLGLGLGSIVGAVSHLAALGLAYAAVAVVLAAATGSPAVTMWGTVGLGIIGHFANSMLMLSETTEAFARLSPFHYYSTALPLEKGADIGDIGTLISVAIVLGAVAFPLFQRRDLRV